MTITMRNKLTERLKSLSNRTLQKPRFPAPPAEARRCAPRKITSLEGKVTFNNTTILRCIVKDKSETGLQIEMEFSNTLPDFVKISVPDLNIKHSAAVIWQDGQLAGLLLDNSS